MEDTQKVANEIAKKFKRRSYIRDYMSEYDLEEIHFLKNGNNYVLKVKSSKDNNKTSLNFTHVKQNNKKNDKKKQRRDSGYGSDIENMDYLDKDNNKYYEYDSLINDSKEIIKKIQDYFDNKIIFDDINKL